MGTCCTQHVPTAVLPTQGRRRRHSRGVVWAALRPPGGQRGAVTAETVMVLPVLVAVTLGLAWVLALASAQVRVVDAAREVARAAARDDSLDQALALGRRVAPRGSTIDVHERGDIVVVLVRAEVRGPQGVVGFLPSAVVDAEAVAARERR